MNCWSRLRELVNIFIFAYMQYDEIIRKLRERDERVTRCFFFWDGPSLKRIDEVRRTDPEKAARMRRPVCNSCRPGLITVLHKLYGNTPFDYDELVTDFYFYLIKDDKLSSIKNPEALMGWIIQSAYFFFLNEKIKKDKTFENVSIEDLNEGGQDIEEDHSAEKERLFVEDVLKAMPNRTYARILDEVTLEVGQYHGREKSELFKMKADKLGIPVDNLYAKVSLAKKQFKETAKRIISL